MHILSDTHFSGGGGGWGCREGGGSRECGWWRDWGGRQSFPQSRSFNWGYFLLWQCAPITCHTAATTSRVSLYMCVCRGRAREKWMRLRWRIGDIERRRQEVKGQTARYTCTYTHAQTHARTQACSHTHMYTRTRTRTRVRVRIHMHIHIHAYPLNRFNSFLCMWLCTGVASVTINHCDNLKTTQVCETQVFHPGLERGKRQPLALVGIYYSIVLEDAACCSVLQCVALQYRTGRCGTPKSEVKRGINKRVPTALFVLFHWK